MEVYLLVESSMYGNSRVILVFSNEQEAIDKAYDLNEKAPEWLHYSVYTHEVINPNE